MLYSRDEHNELKYYEQLAILAYKVSEEVILRHANGINAEDIG